MTKVLRPTAVIPPELYVHREADRQLDRIVDEMGRPPYILEARQMGKTNLLLNLKRHREQLGDIVAYFDLSVRATGQKAFFRGIIDAIVEGDAEWQRNARDSIGDIRRIGQDEPHREYDVSLRLILRSLRSRLIIVFDEVDSLVASEYSDAVFSQIRSMYFSRVNYPEFERLTYVLSGVAEPTELIKDKAISPFNIGDKIHLDDFSRSESDEFIRRAGLGVTLQAREKLYSVTGGNPRMLWDVCADVESKIDAGLRISSDDIDETVHKIYLEKYDRPPIDHIRVLAESDPTIRSAISSIRWGAGETVDTKTRSRLYLAGITRYSTAGTPVIKNPIIDATLSDQWLEEVTSRDRGALQVASDQFRLQRFKEVIETIERHRVESGLPLPFDAQFQLGLANLYEGNYEAARDELKGAVASGGNHQAIMAARYNYGIALHRSGDSESAILEFREVGKSETRSRRVAQVGLMAALSSRDGFDAHREIISIGREVLVSSGDDSDEPLIRTSALYTIASAQERLGESEAALERLREALAIAPERLRPSVLLKLYHLSRDDQNGYLLAAAAAASRVDVSRELTISEIDFTPRKLGELVSILAAEGKDRLGFQLLERLAAAERSGSNSVFRVATDLLNDLAPGLHPEIAGLLWRAIRGEGSASVSMKDRLSVLRLNAEKGHNATRSDATRQYFALATRVSGARDAFDFEDLIFIFLRGLNLASEGRNMRALELIDIVSSNVDVNVESLLLAVSARHQELIISERINDTRRGRNAASAIIALSKTDLAPLDGVASEINGLIQNAVSAAQVALRRFPAAPSSSLKPLGLAPSKSYGRNQRITVMDSTSGKRWTVKFKLVADRIQSGELRVVE